MTPQKTWTIFRTVFFRTPNGGAYYSLPSRVVNRHGGRSMMLFLDGHASSMKASEVGFQYPKGHPLAMWGPGLNESNRKFSCTWPGE